MPPIRIIKRYANRKLYDTVGRCYVTLEEVARLIKEGEELRIIDNKTKADLTSVTMAQILVEEEKRERRSHPLSSLRELIGQSGELLHRKLTEPVHQIRSTVEESVNRLRRTGEERATETRQQIQSWVDQNLNALEEVQHRIDERIKVLLGGLGTLGQLQREVSRLNDRVRRLEAQLGLGEPEPPAGEPEAPAEP